MVMVMTVMRMRMFDEDDDHGSPAGRDGRVDERAGGRAGGCRGRSTSLYVASQSGLRRAYEEDAEGFARELPKYSGEARVVSATINLAAEEPGPLVDSPISTTTSNPDTAVDDSPQFDPVHIQMSVEHFGG